MKLKNAQIMQEKNLGDGENRGPDLSERLSDLSPSKFRCATVISEVTKMNR